MLEARLLNSDATLNNFKEISQVQYVPGEVLKIVIQLMSPQLDGIRYMPADSGATVDMVFQQSDGTELTKAASLVNSLDRSIWTVTLTSTESQAVIGSNIVAVLDELGDDTDIKKAILSYSLSKVFPGDC